LTPEEAPVTVVYEGKRYTGAELTALLERAKANAPAAIAEADRAYAAGEITRCKWVNTVGEPGDAEHERQLIENARKR
jgi:hypothetical protein